MIIAIAGTAGSGKSTVAKALCKKLGYKHYSMGEMQREIAAEKGITIEELGELEKKDDAIDRMIDEKQKKLGKEQDNFIIDSWLGSHFIPHAFKIYMDADIDVRAQRIYSREPDRYESVQKVIEKIQQREATNRERWLEYYDYDYTDMGNYDLIIDTTDKDVDEVVEYVSEMVK